MERDRVVHGKPGQVWLLGDLVIGKAKTSEVHANLGWGGMTWDPRGGGRAERDRVIHAKPGQVWKSENKPEGLPPMNGLARS